MYTWAWSPLMAHILHFIVHYICNWGLVNRNWSRKANYYPNSSRSNWTFRHPDNISCKLAIIIRTEQWSNFSDVWSRQRYNFIPILQLCGAVYPHFFKWAGFRNLLLTLKVDSFIEFEFIHNIFFD